MIRTEPRRSRLFALSESHLYVEEQPQIVLPEVPSSIRLAQPETILEEDEEDEDTEQYPDIDDVPIPERTLHIFLGAPVAASVEVEADADEPPMLDGAFVFPIGAGLPDDDLDIEGDRFDEEPPLTIPPPFIMPTVPTLPHSSLRLLSPPAPPPAEEEPEGFPFFAVGVAVAGMAMAVGMLWL